MCCSKAPEILNEKIEPDNPDERAREITWSESLEAVDSDHEQQYPGDSGMPVKVTPRYQKLIEKELEILGEPEGPLYCAAYPKQRRFSNFVQGEKKNYVEDTEHMPTGLENTLVHRYPGKALYLTTRECIGHCQYCFRPDIAGLDAPPHPDNDNLSPAALDRVCDYLGRNPAIQEIIFSGGDPLACSIDKLEAAIRRVLSIDTVKRCRIHTRAAAYDPERFSRRFIALLEKYNVKLVLHLIHPYELDEESTPPLKEMKRRGIMLYNQFPIIKGINDHPAVIFELGYRCVEAGIQPLSLFVPDPIEYGSVYRVRLERVFAIGDELFRKGEAWLSNVRICLDTSIGKVKQEHIVSYDENTEKYLFSRDGRTVVFYDIPKELDEPASLSKLLYNSSRHVDISLWPDKFYSQNSRASNTFKYFSSAKWEKSVHE